MIKKSHTGYSNTGSYSGQDMTRHTNITQSSSTTGWSKNKHSQINRTQTKPGNIQRATTRGAGQRRGGEGCAGRVRLELQVLRWRGNLLVDVSPTGTDTRTVQTQPSTDTDRFTVTVTVPVQLSGRLCHLEMLRQSLQEGEVTVRQQHSTHTVTDSCATNWWMDMLLRHKQRFNCASHTDKCQGDGHGTDIQRPMRDERTQLTISTRHDQHIKSVQQVRRFEHTCTLKIQKEWLDLIYIKGNYFLKHTWSFTDCQAVD